MCVGGAHGIAVDAFRVDLIAASPFDGIIKAEDDHIPGDEYGHYEPEQQPTGGERRPYGPIQEAVIRLKV
jgi:hypothetical protein